MKNKFLLAIALVSSVLTSCDMDLAPIGQLDDQNALQSVGDVHRFRNGLYSSFRGFSSSKFFTYADIQTDMFNGTIINGNRMGTIANGIVLPSDGDITGYWASCYGAIANINYFLEYAMPLYEKAKADNEDDDIVKYELYLAEAHFFRGYYYAMMFDRWCQVYDASKANTAGLGLPLVTVYAPTADRDKYPGRSTMAETIEFINKDLDAALQGLQDYEAMFPANLEPMAPYLSSYTVKALQARIALWIGDNQKALSISKDIINSGYYTLATIGDYAKMWTDDTSSEIIFMPYESTNETSNSIGSSYISTSQDQADYIPASILISALQAAGTNALTGPKDARLKAFLGERDLTVGSYGKVKTQCFYKFPGNKALQTGNANLMNKPKPFRLSESYLIAAEAAALLNDNATANEMLNTYLSNRIKGYADQNLSGQELLNTIRYQRGIEFVGEGFRLSDLRRWQQGFSRTNGAHYAETPDVDNILVAAGVSVSYTGDDHRYTWPIPSDEIQSNPQMEGQQNPGY